jgi:hypothetical protein
MYPRGAAAKASAEVKIMAGLCWFDLKAAGSMDIAPLCDAKSELTRFSEFDQLYASHEPGQSNAV